jgi:surface protein
MAQIKIAEYTFDNSVGDVTLTLTPNTITMTTEDSVSDTTTRRIVYIDNATMPTRIMFSVREPLLTVDYLNIDSNITSMRQLFHNAKSLTYINVDNWNTSNVTDFYQCFYESRALTQNIDFTKMNLSKVTNWHNAFAYAGFPRIDLSHISPTLTDLSKGLFAYGKAEYIDISGWTFTKTMGQLFTHAEQLKTVVLDNVTTTGVTDMGEMFRNCLNLKTIDVSSFDTSSVTTFTSMFNNCSSLKLANINL